MFWTVSCRRRRWRAQDAFTNFFVAFAPPIDFFIKQQPIFTIFMVAYKQTTKTIIPHADASPSTRYHANSLTASGMDSMITLDTWKGSKSFFVVSTTRWIAPGTASIVCGKRWNWSQRALWAGLVWFTCSSYLVMAAVSTLKVTLFFIREDHSLVLLPGLIRLSLVSRRVHIRNPAFAIFPIDDW